MMRINQRIITSYLCTPEIFIHAINDIWNKSKALLKRVENMKETRTACLCFLENQIIYILLHFNHEANENIGQYKLIHFILNLLKNI